MESQTLHQPGNGVHTAAAAASMIFITGFPQDVKERELHNLVRYLPGYEASQMCVNGGQAQGFALFATPWHAVQAQEAIAGTPFELAPPAAAHAAPAVPITEGADSSPAALAGGTLDPQAGLTEQQHQQQALAAGVSTMVRSAGAEGDEAGAQALLEERASQGGPVVADAVMAEGRLKEGAEDSKSRGAASDAGRLVSRPSQHIFRLRCEIAHKNLHAKETDPSIHRPHKQLLLLPGPPGQYVSVDSPGLNSPPGSVVGGSSMGGGLANPPIYPSAPYPVTHGTGAGTGYGARPNQAAAVQQASARPTGAAVLPTAVTTTAAAAVCQPMYSHSVSELVPAVGVGAPLEVATEYRDWGTARGANGLSLAGQAQRPASGALLIDPRQQPQPQPLSLVSQAAPHYVHTVPGVPYSSAPSPTGGGVASRGGGGMILGGPLGFLPVSNRGDNPPCNTLFVGNLSDTVSEVELCQLFGAQPGYRQMKLVRGPKQVSCFVEFDDIISATTVHQALQGAVLATSQRGGIRIQFSKNPYGRRSPHGDPMAMTWSTPQGTYVPYSGPTWAAPVMQPAAMPHLPPY